MQLIVIGAGFAGVATAYHMARRGVREILVVERESGPGVHASGRNAGLLRQSGFDPELAGLLRQGSRAARAILKGVPGALRENGSLILGSGARGLHRGPLSRWVRAGDVLAGLKGEGLFDPEDALVDPLALLAAFRRRAERLGVQFSFRDGVTGIDVAAGRVRAVRGERGVKRARGVVVAAGAWAGAVAALAGSRSVEIFPRRRHLFRGKVQPPLPVGAPFVWDEGRGVYFRPEGGELLLSPCDATPHEPAVPVVDAGQRDVLAQKLFEAFGSLGDWSIGLGWGCLRTFARDGRFLIGHDRDVKGLFWVAGLGGHGMTASWAVGRLAANVFLGRREPGAFDPARSM